MGVAYTREGTRTRSIALQLIQMKIVGVSGKIADVISELNPEFPYLRTLASNLFEMENNHIYFAQHLPHLTDVHVGKDDFEEVEKMLRYFAFKVLD